MYKREMESTLPKVHTNDKIKISDGLIFLAAVAATLLNGTSRRTTLNFNISMSITIFYP